VEKREGGAASMCRVRRGSGEAASATHSPLAHSQGLAPSIPLGLASLGANVSPVRRHPLVRNRVAEAALSSKNEFGYFFLPAPLSISTRPLRRGSSGASCIALSKLVIAVAVSPAAT
jgi:hypothetical protein